MKYIFVSVWNVNTTHVTFSKVSYISPKVSYISPKVSYISPKVSYISPKCTPANTVTNLYHLSFLYIAHQYAGYLITRFMRLTELCVICIFLKETTFPFNPSLYAGHICVQREQTCILQPPTVAGIREVARRNRRFLLNKEGL